ncbi:hypothetical protein ACQ4PT_009198 [Festuca glaucescens]
MEGLVPQARPPPVPHAPGTQGPRRPQPPSFGFGYGSGQPAFAPPAWPLYGLAGQKQPPPNFAQQPASGFQQQLQVSVPGVMPKRKNKKKKAGAAPGLAPGGSAPQVLPQLGQVQTHHMQGQVQQGMGHPNMYQYPFIPQGYAQQAATLQQQVMSQQQVSTVQPPGGSVTTVDADGARAKLSRSQPSSPAKSASTATAPHAGLQACGQTTPASATGARAQRPPAAGARVQHPPAAGAPLEQPGAATPMVAAPQGVRQPPSPPRGAAAPVAGLGGGSTSSFPPSETGVGVGASLEGGPASPLPSSKGTQPMYTGLQTPTRRSTRHRVAADGAVATDEDSMAKAMHRKAAANLDTKVLLQAHSALAGGGVEAMRGMAAAAVGGRTRIVGEKSFTRALFYRDEPNEERKVVVLPAFKTVRQGALRHDGGGLARFCQGDATTGTGGWLVAKTGSGGAWRRDDGLTAAAAAVVLLTATMGSG